MYSVYCAILSYSELRGERQNAAASPSCPFDVHCALCKRSITPTTSAIPAKSPNLKTPNLRLRTHSRRQPGRFRKGGLALKLYEHSLTLALLLLFFVSFVLHARSAASAHSEQVAAAGCSRLVSITVSDQRFQLNGENRYIAACRCEFGAGPRDLFPGRAAGEAQTVFVKCPCFEP